MIRTRRHAIKGKEVIGANPKMTPKMRTNNFYLKPQIVINISTDMQK
jgi:hypothetical protein